MPKNLRVTIPAVAPLPSGPLYATRRPTSWPAAPTVTLATRAGTIAMPVTAPQTYATREGAMWGGTIVNATQAPKRVWDRFVSYAVSPFARQISNAPGIRSQGLGDYVNRNAYTMDGVGYTGVGLAIDGSADRTSADTSLTSNTGTSQAGASAGSPSSTTTASTQTSVMSSQCKPGFTSRTPTSPCIRMTTWSGPRGSSPPAAAAGYKWKPSVLNIAANPTWTWTQVPILASRASTWTVTINGVKKSFATKAEADKYRADQMALIKAAKAGQDAAQRASVAAHDTARAAAVAAFAAAKAAHQKFLAGMRAYSGADRAAKIAADEAVYEAAEAKYYETIAFGANNKLLALAAKLRDNVASLLSTGHTTSPNSYAAPKVTVNTSGGPAIVKADTSQTVKKDPVTGQQVVTTNQDGNLDVNIVGDGNGGATDNNGDTVVPGVSTAGMAEYLTPRNLLIAGAVGLGIWYVTRK